MFIIPRERKRRLEAAAEEVIIRNPDMPLEAAGGIVAENEGDNVPMEAAGGEVAENEDDNVPMEASDGEVGEATVRDESDDSSDNSDSEIISCESTLSNSSKDSWDASTLQKMFDKHSINDASAGSPLRTNIKNQHHSTALALKDKRIGTTDGAWRGGEVLHVYQGNRGDEQSWRLSRY